MHHPVSKIKNKGLSREHPKDFIRFPFKDVTTFNQINRIKISLKYQAGLKMIPCPFPRHSLIKAKRGNRDLLGIPHGQASKESRVDQFNPFEEYDSGLAQTELVQLHQALLEFLGRTNVKILCDPAQTGGLALQFL